ncbi:hypothetical protein [Cyclobacterium plantarum]|uniref:hypothetical protein n=1 Tax=Cyclobacterium plantarum TaxID=2716263 RepID=UPI003F71CFB7
MRLPYIERIYNGSELVSNRRANVMFYYDVTLDNTDQMSIFSVSLSDKNIEQFQECDFVFSENDYPLRKYLLELEIVEEEVDEIMELVISKIIELYFNNKERGLIEFETK